MNNYVCSKYEHVWVRLPVRMTVRIILEPYTYSMNIVRRRLGPLLLYQVPFALCLCELYLHEWRSVQCESTGIQNVNCVTNTITTHSPCVSPRMKLIRSGYKNFLNMFKNFGLATRVRRTLFEWIVIVIVIARMTMNDQEWSLEPTWMVDSCSFGDRFGTVERGIKETTSNYYICQNIVLSSWQRKVRVKGLLWYRPKWLTLTYFYVSWQ